METVAVDFPLVSVIIPAYNASQYICDTIESVLGQDYQYLEVIVVDDGSSDDTVDIVARKYGSQLRLLRQPNSGASAARNYGYSNSSGKLIKFLDADDLINPEMIRQQVELALEHPETVISATWGRFYENDLSTFKFSPEHCWQTLPSFEWLLSSWEYASSMTNPGIFLIPRAIIEKAGPWDQSLSRLDDTEYFARTISMANQVVFSPESILYYRSGIPGNLSGAKSPNAIISTFSAYKKTTEILLSRDYNLRTRQICANIWQRFLYDFYPNAPDKE